MSSFDYTIQGVKLTDDRWSNNRNTEFDGPWHMAQGTGVLPEFPGLKVTRFSLPDQHGESQTQLAPLQPRALPLRMRFLGVQAAPGARMGLMGRTWEERYRNIEANVNDFLFRSSIARSINGGLLQMERRLYGLDHVPGEEDLYITGGTQYADGRVVSSSQAEMDPDARWAEYTFVFEIPTGTWYTRTQRVEANIPTAFTNFHLNVPMGTAPVWDAVVAIRPNSGVMPAGCLVTNDLGTGFRTHMEMNRWWVMDTETGMAGPAGDTAERPAWDARLFRTGMVGSHGRSEGSALLISPGISGSGRRLGRVRVRLTRPGKVIISLRPRFF